MRLPSMTEPPLELSMICAEGVRSASISSAKAIRKLDWTDSLDRLQWVQWVVPRHSV